MNTSNIYRFSKIALMITVLIFSLSAIWLMRSMLQSGKNSNHEITNNIITVSQQEKQNEILNKKLKNEIDCPEKFSNITDLPLDIIKGEIYRRYFLLGFYNNDVPFFDTINSVRCFDLNKDNNAEYLLKIRIADLNNKEGIGNLLIEKANAGAPQTEYTLLIFMEKGDSKGDWNIIWSDQFDNTMENNDPAIENGKQDNSIKIGNYYLMLDGETPRFDIDGEFRDVNVKDKKFGEFPARESNMGDYYTEMVWISGNEESHINATRIWKKDGDIYRFITDLPHNNNVEDYNILSYFSTEQGDVVYLLNVPSDTFCSLGLTKLETRNNKISFPRFTMDFNDCEGSASPDHKKILSVGAQEVHVYDLFNENDQVVENWEGESDLTANKIYQGGREFEGNFEWIDNETFYYDVFKEIGENVENNYVETRIWKMTEDGKVVKVKAVNKNKESIF